MILSWMEYLNARSDKCSMPLVEFREFGKWTRGRRVLFSSLVLRCLLFEIKGPGFDCFCSARIHSRWEVWILHGGSTNFRELQLFSQWMQRKTRGAELNGSVQPALLYSHVQYAVAFLLNKATLYETNRWPLLFCVYRHAVRHRTKWPMHNSIPREKYNCVHFCLNLHRCLKEGNKLQGRKPLLNHTASFLRSNFLRF